MGNKTPSAPSFKPSEVRYGKSVIGKTYINPNTGAIVNQYLPDAAEIERRKLIQQRINSLLPTLGITAPEIAAKFDQTEKAFVDDAKQKFTDQYDPALRELREDTAARFGTLNTSQFFQNLNDLEKNKASAFVDIINRGKMLRQDLTQQEEDRKTKALQGLAGMFNSDRSNLYDALQEPLDTAGYLNDFSNSQWMAQLRDYRDNILSKRSAQAALGKEKGLKGLLMGKFI